MPHDRAGRGARAEINRIGAKTGCPMRGLTASRNCDARFNLQARLIQRDVSNKEKRRQDIAADE